MDELHSHVGHKKTTAGSTPTGHKGRLLIDMGNGCAVGSRDAETGRRAWVAIGRPRIEAVMTDYLCPLGIGNLTGILCPLRCIRNPIPTGHKGRDLHGGRLQQPVAVRLGKVETENQVLQQKPRYAGMLGQAVHGLLE